MQKRLPALIPVAALVVLLAGTAWAIPPAELLLPKSTKGFIAVSNVPALVSKWRQTSLGKLMEDPAMEPFFRQLHDQLAKQEATLEKRLGVTWEDLKDVPAGQLAIALLAPQADKAELILLADITGRRVKAEALAEKLVSTLKEQNARELSLDGTTAPMKAYVLPPSGKRSQELVVAYAMDDRLLVVASSVQAVEDAWQRYSSQATTDCLATVEVYQAVMKRCLDDAGESVPDIRWFVDPFAYAEALASTIRTRRTVADVSLPEQPNTLDRLRAAGFDAIKAIGGFIHVNEKPFQIIHRTAIYAPRPYEKSMKMFSFSNVLRSEPPDWFPRDAAGCLMLACNLQEAFANIGPVFDQFVGEGEEGVWQDVLDSLKNDPNGPQIDLEKELVQHLGSKVYLLTQYKRPITPTSERLLFVIETTNPKQVATALEKTMRNDKEVRRREYKGLVIWETIPAEQREAVSVNVEVPSLQLGPGSQPFGPRLEEQFPEEERKPLLPNASMTVANGCLLIASHYDYLIEILERQSSQDRLVDSVEYKLVSRLMDQLCGQEGFLRVFYRADLLYEPTYELVRQGKMPEGQTLLARLINAILPAEQEGQPRKPRVSGENLPEFEIVRRHLGPVGLFGKTVEDGWFFKGFMLQPGLE